MSVPCECASSARLLPVVQYIYYMALQRQRERLYTRRLMRQQRHLHYMHHGSDPDSPLPPSAHGGRSSDEVCVQEQRCQSVLAAPCALT